ncbi:MAG: hypothetical protein ACREQB_04465 [Candidatus Binataceae bacterium]
MIATKRTVDETLELLADQKAPLLALAAAKCAMNASTGDIAAMKEIGDRIDGKPKQQTELSGPDGEAIPVGMDVRIIAPASGNT